MTVIPNIQLIFVTASILSILHFYITSFFWIQSYVSCKHFVVTVWHVHNTQSSVIRGYVNIFGMTVKYEDDCISRGKLGVYWIIYILGCNMERLIEQHIWHNWWYDTGVQEWLGPNKIFYCNEPRETLNCWTKWIEIRAIT